MRKPKLTVCAGFYFRLALSFLLLPIPWVLAWMIAAAIHEALHGLALRLFHYRVYGLELKFSGIRMETEPLQGASGVICALAAPVGCLAFVIVMKWIPRIAVCALLQSFYNLLPVYPLDGGRALRLLLDKLDNPRLSSVISIAVETALWAAAVLVNGALTIRYHLGLFPSIALIILWLSLQRAKKSCNARGKGVQYS